MKVLVAYFSQSGKTRRIAEAIAAAENADVERIEEAKERYTGFGWHLAAGLSALLRRKSEIREPRLAPEDYDLVFVGTPIWAGRMAPAVRSYLLKTGMRGRKVALFCTMSRSGAKGAFDDISKLLEDCQVLGGLPVSEEELNGEKLGRKLDLWLSRVARRA